MGELDLIASIRRLTSSRKSGEGIVLGIGDDCAIFRPKIGTDLIFTTDFCIENRHFRLDTHKAEDVGHKALARSLSDLAAMGGEPAFCLVSLAIPDRLTKRWVKSFYRGLLGLADESSITLIGGDLAKADAVTIDVMCCGRTPKNKAMRRDRARPGDRIYVTGELGESALGFATRKGKAWKRHLRPAPRVAAGIVLSKLGVKAAMDLSDGLSLDLHRLCLASNVSASLTGDLPFAKGATTEQALHGGEDYELLFTASPKLNVPCEIGGVPVTNIGNIVKGTAGQIIFAGRTLSPSGFDHFRRIRTRTSGQTGSGDCPGV